MHQERVLQLWGGVQSKASGPGSISIGYNTEASGDNATAMGMFNYDDTDNLFAVGNGDDTSRSNALVIRTDGKIGLGLGQGVPTEAVEIGGAVKIGTTANGCSDSNRGAIKYENDNFYGCNSTGWVQLNN